MELHGESTRRTTGYRNAHNVLRKFDRPLSSMSLTEIEAIPGIGKSSGGKIIELLEKGRMSGLDSYLEKTPAGIVELLSIRGLGPSKVRTIWKELGIESPDVLLYACNENRLIQASGFGVKTQADVKQKLEYYLESQGKWLYSKAEPIARELLGILRSFGNAARVDVVGELIRRCPIIHEVEFVGADIDMDALLQHPDITIEENGEVINAIYEDAMKFKLHSSDKQLYVSSRFKLIGNADFVNGIEISPEAQTDEEVFAKAGLPYVIPEMRESAEVIKSVSGSEAYIEVKDLKGIIHNHSTYSDGLHTLRQMAEYVRDSGYAYFGISDHSKTAVYANGLPIDRVLRQFEEIDALNDELAPFRIFKGIESDILQDGSLDYDEDILMQFDFIVASIHSGLNMDEEKATNRIQKAIENPFTDMLGHPTGRLLLSRKGYPIDHKRIIDACSVYDVAIEINANPLRLDMDYTWISYAIEKGVMISINPDAHSMGSIHNVRYGVYAARKGGLQSKHCLNALSADEFADWLMGRRVDLF